MNHARNSGVECRGLCKGKGETSEPGESCSSSVLLSLEGQVCSVALSVVQSRERRLKEVE